MDPRDRMRRLAEPDTTWDPPWAGGFIELREHDAQTASGYNEPQVSGDAVSYREFELLPDE